MSFEAVFRDLPAVLPVFPLTGVLLLPRGRLPLNIFEPRYLAMIDDALKGDRLIGMVQPRGSGEPPPLFDTGCAGRIVSYDETDDGRYLIVLSGICRFTIADEFPVERGYRRVQANWSRFKADLDEEECPNLDRAKLVALLQTYFQRQGLSANWEAIESTPDERLVTSLAMICPFEACEKQALLEAPDLAERAEIMIKILAMSAAGGNEPEGDHSRH
jgi:Lon protease-like protein